MPINELDPIRRPGEIDEDDREAMSPGERVRALKDAEDGVPLPVHT